MGKSAPAEAESHVDHRQWRWTAWPERAWKSVQPSSSSTCSQSCSVRPCAARTSDDPGHVGGRQRAVSGRGAAVAAGDIASAPTGWGGASCLRMVCDGVRAFPVPVMSGLFGSTATKQGGAARSSSAMKRGLPPGLQRRPTTRARNAMRAARARATGWAAGWPLARDAGPTGPWGRVGAGRWDMNHCCAWQTRRSPKGLQEGLEQGKQEAADSWPRTSRMKGRTRALRREVKIRNTIYRSRQSTAGRPDAVGV